MSNKPLKKVIPGITRHMALLNELLPPESGYNQHSKFKESLIIEVGGIFRFRHEDLCATHLATYIKLADEYEKYDKAYDLFKKRIEDAKTSLGENPDPESLESIEFSYYMRLQDFRTHELYLDSIRSFADQHFIVGLWVILEQTIAKLLKLYKEKTNKTFEIPYKWDQTIALFKTLNIVTDDTLSIYQNINELRVLNNKIKHLNEVDEKLARFPFFNSMLGKSIDRVRLELQRYSDNSYAFVHFIAEQLIVE